MICRLLPLVVAGCLATSSVQAAQHPLDPLTQAELSEAVRTVQAAKICTATCYYPFVWLHEPSKDVLRSSNLLRSWHRQAQVTVMDRANNAVHEVVADLPDR